MNIFEKIENLGSKWWGIVILLGAPITAALAPILLRRAVFFNMDNFYIMYPAFAFYKDSLSHADSFLWNPNNFSGFPIFTGLVSGFLSPIYYLFFRSFPVFDAYHLLIIFHLLVAAIFFFYFLKNLGLSFWGSYIGGIVYIFANWRIINDLPIVVLLPFIPLLLLSILKVYRGNWTWIFTGGLGGGLMFLSGHYHYLLESALAVFISSFFIAWLSGDHGWKGAVKTCLVCVMVLLLAGLISFFRFIPAFVYADYSWRAGGVSFWEYAAAGLSWAAPIQFFSPYFELSGPIAKYFPVAGEQKYIGIIPIFLIFYVFSLKSVSRPVRFFSFFSLTAIIASLPYSPLAWMLNQFPILNFLTSPVRWMFVGYFGFAALAGIGFEKFFNMEKINRRAVVIFRLLWSFGAVFWISIFVGWIITFVFGEKMLSFLISYFDKNFYTSDFSLPLEHYHKYIERVFYDMRYIFNIFSPKVFLPAVFFFASMFLLKRYFAKQDKKRFWAGISAVFTVLNLVFVFYFYQAYLSRASFRDLSQTAGYLQKAESGRILSFVPGQSEFFKLSVRYGAAVPAEMSFLFQNEMLEANLNLLYGLSGIDYYESLVSRQMSRLVSHIGGTRGGRQDAVAYLDLLPEEKSKIIESRKNLLNFAGVRYIISAYPFDELRFPKIFETAVIPPYNISIAIYKNKEARPLFYFADSLETIPEDERAAFEKLKTIPEEGLGVFVECDFSNIGCSREHPMLLKNFDGRGEIEIKTKKNTISIFKTQSKIPQFLVFSENHLPGWKAYIDGFETTIYTVGSVYMGIAVPEGAHEIKFEFTYRTIIEEFAKVVKEKIVSSFFR